MEAINSIALGKQASREKRIKKNYSAASYKKTQPILYVK